MPRGLHKDGDALIGSRVRQARMRAGITQAELGAHLGITFQQVQKYENGKNRISASALVSMASFIGAPILSLLGPADDAAGSSTDPHAETARRLVAGLPSVEAKSAAIRAIISIGNAFSDVPAMEAAE